MQRTTGWLAIINAAALLGCSSGSRETSRPEAGAGSEDTGKTDGPEPGAFAPSIAMSSVQRVSNPQIPAADVSTLANDNAAFALAAYKQLALDNGNLVFSPASISIALAMAYAGAAGNTAAEMATALHFTLPPARLHPAFNGLDQALASCGQGALGADGAPMRLKIANAVWAKRDYLIKRDFLDTLAASYGAGVHLVDFALAPDSARVAINDGVAQQTENKIQNLLPPGSVDHATRLVLTDAVYLNAAWGSPFSAHDTISDTFTLLDGRAVSVKFMRQWSNLPAVQTSNYVAASLPYADPRLSFLLVVPATGQLSQVEASLDPDTLTALVAGLTTQRVVLSLPRFEIETQASLKKLLGTLGMPSAFEDRLANFSGISDEPTLHISDVLHQAFINVGEKGTEAAAATAVVFRPDGGLAPPPPPALPVLANRPFIYILRDQTTGAIVFMGRVLDPSAP